MSSKFAQVQEIARASLMPDFFAVRIEEEGLYPDLQRLIAAIKLPSPLPGFDRIQQITAASATPIAMVDGLKAEDLWNTLRDVLTHIKVK